MGVYLDIYLEPPPLSPKSVKFLKADIHFWHFQLGQWHGM